jgi:hypothetical protein
VVEVLARTFDGTPNSIFGAVVDELEEQAEQVPWNRLIPQMTD